MIFQHHGPRSNSLFIRLFRKFTDTQTHLLELKFALKCYNLFFTKFLAAEKILFAMSKKKIEMYKNSVFSGNLFDDFYWDETVDCDGTYSPYSYPSGAVYFAIDTNTIIAYGLETPTQTHSRLLKKIKNEHFEVDFRITPKYVETNFGNKITYFAKKVQNVRTIVKKMKFSLN